MYWNPWGLLHHSLSSVNMCQRARKLALAEPEPLQHPKTTPCTHAFFTLLLWRRCHTSGQERRHQGCYRALSGVTSISLSTQCSSRAAVHESHEVLRYLLEEGRLCVLCLISSQGKQSGARECAARSTVHLTPRNTVLLLISLECPGWLPPAAPQQVDSLSMWYQNHQNLADNSF